VAAGNDIGEFGYTWLDEGGLKVTAHVRGRNGIERNEAALGRDDDFVSIKSSRRHFLERCTDGALASLAAVIDRGVDDVAARFDGMNDRVVVELVRFGVVVAEIGAEPDRREPQSLGMAEMFRGNPRFEAFAIAFRACFSG
jgi:hypothetical protein